MVKGSVASSNARSSSKKHKVFLKFCSGKNVDQGLFFLIFWRCFFWFFLLFLISFYDFTLSNLFWIHSVWAFDLFWFIISSLIKALILCLYITLFSFSNVLIAAILILYFWETVEVVLEHQGFSLGSIGCTSCCILCCELSNEVLLLWLWGPKSDLSQTYWCCFHTHIGILLKVDADCCNTSLFLTHELFVVLMVHREGLFPECHCWIFFVFDKVQVSGRWTSCCCFLWQLMKTTIWDLFLSSHEEFHSCYNSFAVSFDFEWCCVMPVWDECLSI